MKFGVWHIVVLDDGIPFKGKALKLNHDILTKRNHNGLSVEHSHRFLNKAATISMDDRQSNDVSVSAGIAAGHAWNSTPNDLTDMLRSTVAIGREFRFPIDVNLYTCLNLHIIMHNLLLSLRITDFNRRISSSILKTLIEDRRKAHDERVNNNKNIVDLVLGDIVMASTLVQNDTSTNKVAKLSYQVHGLFCIVTCTG